MNKLITAILAGLFTISAYAADAPESPAAAAKPAAHAKKHHASKTMHTSKKITTEAAPAPADAK